MPINKIIRQSQRVPFFVIKYAYSFLVFFYLLSVGFFLRKNRILIYQIISHFNPFAKRISLNIPQVQLRDIIAATPVLVTEFNEVKGNITLLEMAILNLFVKSFNPKNIFEIGTFDGRTTLNLSLNSSDDAKVFTIDLPKDGTMTPALSMEPDDKLLIEKRNISQDRFLNQEQAKIVQLFGDTATFDFTPFFNKMDMVFVDGAHSFKYVSNDSSVALKMLKGGKGLIFWHDYRPTMTGVVGALNKLSSDNHRFKIFHIAGTALVCLIAR